MQTRSLYAAIDLGSNSFRLEIGQMDLGQLRRVESVSYTHLTLPTILRV